MAVKKTKHVIIILLLKIFSAPSSYAESISGVRSKIRDVESQISRVQGETRSGESRLNSIDLDISRAESETQSFRSKTISHRSAEAGYDAEYRGYEQEKIKVKERLGAVFQEIHNLQTQVDFREQKNSELRDLIAKALQLGNDQTKLEKTLEHQDKAFVVARDAHLKWLVEFKTLVAQSAPNFDAIQDATSYKLAHAKVFEFMTAFPSQSSVNVMEDKLLYQTRSSLKDIADLQNALRSLMAHPAHGSLLAKNSSSTTGRAFAELDEALNRQHQEVSKAESLIYVHREKRSYLMDTVPMVWIKLIKARLHAANLETAVNEINGIDAALHSPYVYAQVKLALLMRDNNASELLDHFLMPLHARRAAIAAIEYAEHVLQQLPNLHLSPSMRNAVTALVADKKINFASIQRDAEMNCVNPMRFFNERKRLTKIAFARFSANATPYCANLAHELLTATHSDVMHEAKFKDFRTLCP